MRISAATTRLSVLRITSLVGFIREKFPSLTKLIYQKNYIYKNFCSCLLAEYTFLFFSERKYCLFQEENLE